MKVVSDAGPLIALGKLGSIDLPFRLFGQILIPRAVYVEVVNRGNELGAPDAKQTELAVAHQQLAVVILADRDLPESVRLGALSQADQQTLALALRERADWVLIDDLLARQTAKHLGLKVKGTLGVIVEAFRTGLLSGDDCEFLLQAILRDDDIWIDEGLIRQAQQEIKKEMRGG